MTIHMLRDNLFRGLLEPPVLRAADETDPGDAPAPSLMYGHFTVFDTWSEIDSFWEGQFLERIARGSFKKTIRDNRAGFRVQYDHGYDTFVGSAPLGPIEVLREEDEGPYYEVPLLDTDYNRDRVQPLLSGQLMNGDATGESLLGASFRFRVIRDEWNEEPDPSDDNPKGLPERTIREVALYEFGPVVFPAYPTATAKVRSLTDHYEALRLARLGTSARAIRQIAETAGIATVPVEPESPAAGIATSGATPGERVAFFRSLLIRKDTAA
jgi:hypothetical protein